MKLNIDIGHPEALLFCGTCLMVSDYGGSGMAMLILGLLGGIFRAGFKIQETQLRAKEKEKVRKEVNNTGEELAKGIGQILTIFAGSAGKNKGGDFH